MLLKNCILLDDEKTLLNICGVNDKILKKIEDICDCKIYYHGNELYYESKDPQLIENLIKSLINITQHNTTITESLIEILYNEIKNNNITDIIKLLSINIEIPKSKMIFKPKTINQGLYLNLLKEKDIVFSSGPAGTGKTFIAIVYAINELLNKRTKKVVLTRPVVEAGENLGFLPGDFTQKINPYLVPLFSSINYILTPEIHSKLNEQNLIEIAPLAYMRGRTFSDSIVILDEAQNTTYNQMKLFLTRPGENVKMIITGDLTQIDLPNYRKSGMLQSIKILKSIKEIGFIEFNDNDVIRHPLVKKILSAYNKYENSKHN